MENNNNSNDNNYKKHTKTKSMKMQDFFGITNLDLIKSKSEQIKIKEKTPEENESDENEEALGSYNNNNNNNNNLYEYLYDSAMEAEEPSLYQSTDRIKIKENIISEKINEINNQSKKDNIQEKKIIIQEQIYPIESINIFIDDIKTEYADFVIQNYQCKFIFDDKVLAKFVNLVHFTPKYFEFPLFYAYKGSYDEVTNITTITLKDYRSYKISSKNKSIYKQLFDKNQNKVDFYKYAYFYKDVQDKKNIKYEIDGWDIYKPRSEYKRQGIEFSDTKFCFSNLNSKYELCETYPNILVIPKKFDNKELFNIAKSRMKNRFPILSYCYHYESSSGKKKIKSYMYRSAQIKKSGIIFKSKNLEVEYMNEITNIEKNNQGFIIFDCRSEFAAKANTFKGAGSEDPKHYKNCIKLIFGAIENIHSIRKSLKNALQKAYYGNENIIEGKISFSIKNNNEKNFLSKFESTKWLEYLSALLIGSICVAKKLYQNINVLVHCSDGWDRTAQVCSLVQIILDPYFRTIEGFAVLVEKEWVSFGHKFAMRNGCDVRKEKKKDRSPIFIQFIHAVQQMTMQYPTAFEYNNNFLLFLCDEIYSNKYGTFLFNCEKDKFNNNQEKKTISIWSDIFYEKNKYINDIYKPINGTINVKGELKYLNIWNDFFFKYDKVGMAYKNRALLDKQEYVAKILEEKNKSILELLNVIKSNGLENLVKDNKIYNLYKDKLDKSE